MGAVLWEGVNPCLTVSPRKVLPGPGLLLHSLPPKTGDKAVPSVSAGASGHGGGGGEAASSVADSFRLSSTLSEGRAPLLFLSP